MEHPYKAYRHWLDAAEANIRMRLVGWNVELHERKKGTFELVLGRPLREGGAETKVFLTVQQVDEIARDVLFKLEDVLEFAIDERGPLGA